MNRLTVWDTVWLEGPGERQSVTGVDQLSVGSTSSLLHGVLFVSLLIDRTVNYQVLVR